MEDGKGVLVVVHPGSACGSADFNLGDGAGRAREELAREIMSWPGDMLIVDGDLSDEIEHYAILAIALENAADRRDRKIVRRHACDTTEGWPDIVREAFDSEWPEGPRKVVVTGAWIEDSGGGCVRAVADALIRHRVAVAESAFRLP